MKFLRKIFWLQAKFDFHLVASWIPMEANTVADAISCLDFAFFLSCSGILPSGISGNLSPTTAIVGKCYAVHRRWPLLGSAVHQRQPSSGSAIHRRWPSSLYPAFPLSTILPILILWSSGTC
jgi:hypothetical protein